MRSLPLLAAAAFALSACGNDDQVGNVVNIEADLTAENIVANDVTAIDAVTADSANMAADVDISLTNELTNEGEAGVSPKGPAPKPKASSPPAKASTAPASPTPTPEPSSNAAATNTAE